MIHFIAASFIGQGNPTTQHIGDTVNAWYALLVGVIGALVLATPLIIKYIFDTRALWRKFREQENAIVTVAKQATVLDTANQQLGTATVNVPSAISERVATIAENGTGPALEHEPLKPPSDE